MTPEEIRLECLRLSVPRDIANPDTDLILTRAKAYETYVSGKGQSSDTSAAPNKLSLPTSNKPGQPASQQTRQQR